MLVTWKRLARGLAVPAAARLGIVAVLAAMVATAILPTTAAAAVLAAKASLTPSQQFLNDTAGTTFTLTVQNTGSNGIGAVRIARPNSFWTIQSCPTAPSGWSTVATTTSCTFTSGASSTDDIAATRRATFTLRARTSTGDQNRFGKWNVTVSRTNSFSNAANIRQAGAMPPKLKTKLFSFEILDAVVTTAPGTPGAACPAGLHSVTGGSGPYFLVICGRNRTTGTRTPIASQARLLGTFVASHGAFTSGPVAPSTTSRVLGNWANVVVTGTSGSGKTVLARVGSSRSRTSPDTTLAGFTALNIAPVVTTSAGSLAYPENAGALAIDPALTVSDGDDVSLAGATVRISSGLNAATDSLGFAAQNGITGTYDSGTGVLTLTGSATVANYQAALRSVTFTNSSDTPTTARSIAFSARDEVGYGSESIKAIGLSPVNDAPVVTTSAGTAGFTEGGAPAFVDPGLTVSDVDSATLNGATVSVTGNFSSADGDTLSFVNQNGITGSYNSGTGVLTLTGSATVAIYQAALRSVGFSNTSHNPSLAARTVSFQVTDSGAANSNIASRAVTVSLANDAPSVATSGGSASYTENSAPAVIDPALTVADADDTNIESGQVRISVGFQAGDTLAFTPLGGVTGNYDSGTGVLTFTGAATKAAYESLLRSVSYSSGTNDNPSASKTVEFKVNDGDADSNLATRSLTITGVNDAPTVTTTGGSASYTEGGTATAIDAAVNVTDPDSTTLAGATVSITANFSSTDGDTLNFVNQNGINGSYNSGTGVLTLSNTASLANYITGLQSITFSLTGDNPSTLTRTVSFQVNDGGALANLSNVATRTVTVSAANDAPTVTTNAVGTTAYTEGAGPVAIDPALTVADADDTNIESGQVRISVGFQAGDTLAFTPLGGVTGNYDSGTGVLTFTGAATKAAYESLLRSVSYSSGTNDNPSASKTVEFKVNDGDADSNLATRSLTITGVNDAPTVTTTGGSASYTEGGTATAIDAAVNVTDPDSTTLLDATVRISANFSAASGDTLNFVNQNGINGSYNSATGDLSLIGTASIADYITALRSVTFSLTSDTPSTATRTVSFRVNDAGVVNNLSNVATRTVTVSASNDAPTVTATGGNTAYGEGAAAVVIDNGVTVTDPDDTNIESGDVRISVGFQNGDALNFFNTANVSGSYNTTTGVLTLTPIGSATVAQFESALRSITFSSTSENPPTAKTVQFQVNDGDADSNATSKVIDVTPVNDGPVNTVPSITSVHVNATLNFSGGSAISVADADAGTSDITVTLTSTNGTMSLSGTTGLTTVTGNGTALVVATGPLTAINAALNGSMFTPTAVGPASVEVKSDDLGNTGSGGPFTDTDLISFTVTPPNSPPAPQDQTSTPVAVAEDGSVSITLVAIDADGDPTTAFTISGGPSNGGLGTIGLITCGGGTPNTCQADVQYTPTANYFGSDSFTFTASDATSTSGNGTVSITVNAVNDAPVLAAIEGTSLPYTENDGATQITATTTVADIDSADFDTGALTVDYTTGGTADDRLEIANQGTGPTQIGVSGSDVSYEGTTIGTFVGGSGTTALVVTLNSFANAAATQALVRAITYRNVSDNPATATRTVRFVLTDGDGGTSSPVTRDIALSAVNDAPVLALIESADLGYTENDPATAITSSMTVTDSDSDISGATIEIVNNYTNPEDVLAFANQLGISVVSYTGGVLTLTGTASPASYQTALRAVTYANGSDNPSAATRFVSFKVKDATLIDSNQQSRNITVTPVNDAPVADDESFTGTDSAVGNTLLVVNDPTDVAPTVSAIKKSITGDLLDGDTDVDGPSALSITPVTDQATTNGGKVTIEADGDFVYVSNGCSPTPDSFSYTITDSHPTDPQTDTGLVTIALSGCVWYVDNSAAPGGTGTSSAPFDTLAEAEAASAAGNTIFVFKGTGTTLGYSAGIGLKDNQVLQGETVDLVVGPDTLWTGNPANRPTITDLNADVVALASGNTVKGIEVDPQGTGGGIVADSGENGGTITDVRIVDTLVAGSEASLEIGAVAVSSIWTVSNLTVDNTGATGQGVNSKGIYLHGPATATVTFAATGTISIATTGAAALDADTIGLGTSVFDSISVANSGSGGVRLFNLSLGSDTTLGDGNGNDLSLTTTSGATAALLISSGRTVTVPGAGTANISATGGPAIDISGTTITSLAFDNVSSANSATNGVRLTDLGSGTFSATGGTISGVAAGFTSFVVSNGAANGTGNVTYAGTLGNGSGQALAISGRSGGTVDITGPIQDTNDIGGGVTVTSNTGGVTNISNASVTINTTTSGGVNNVINNAITFSASDGHTLNITGGNLDIDAGAGNGKGIDADFSGAITITGANNTIDTTTGRALNISDTDIGDNDVTFLRISSNGANGGIRVNNSSNVNGRLVVAGNGGTCTSAATCTGGAIQNSVGSAGAGAPGIELTSLAGGASFTRMSVNNGNDDGIRATTVGVGISLLNSVVTTNGNAVTENGLHWVDVTGTSTISGTTVSGSGEHNALINTTTGTHNIDVINSTFSLNNNTTGGDGLQFSGSGNSTIVNADITGNVFSQSRDAGFRMISGTGDPELNLNFINNDVTGGHPTVVPGAPGVVIAAGDGTDLKARVENNDILDSRGSALILNPIPNSTDGATFEAIVNNNRIGDNDADSGSLEGIALWVQANGSGDTKISITNNTIKHWQQNAMRIQSGERLLGGDPATNQSGTAHVTITGNVLQSPDPSSVDTISLIVGVQSGAASQDVCFDLGGAGALSNSIGGLAGPGTFDLKISERFAGNLWFPGFVGDGTNQAVIETFIRSRNTGNPTVALIDNGISGGAPCAGPTSPPAVTP